MTLGYLQLRHGRACPGHPFILRKRWMRGSSPRMTKERMAYGSSVALIACRLQRLSGMVIRRPAASGNGSMACAAFILARQRAISAGKAVVFFAPMSTCSDMFSEVVDTQPSLA